MPSGKQMIQEALAEGRETLTEHESKEFLRTYGIPVTREKEVQDEQGLRDALKEIPFPLVLKGSSHRLPHKSEHGLVRLDIRNGEEAASAFREIMSCMEGTDGAVLVQEMIRGSRELMVGMTRDAQFGPCVMFGLGGIFTEVLKDVSFRVAPLQRRDAVEMMREIRAQKILQEVRGLPAADMDELTRILLSMGQIGLEHEGIQEIDINPLILAGSRPVAVDALIVLSPPFPNPVS